MGPDTLQEAVLYFSSSENCREYLVAHRWPDGVTCPRCGGKNVLFQSKYNRWQCGSKHDLRQFTPKTGTIFEDSPLGLDKWLLALWMVVNRKNGVSSYEIHRATGITQKSAWFMSHRIRLALGMAPEEKRLSGEVEVDEAFIRTNPQALTIDPEMQSTAGTRISWISPQEWPSLTEAISMPLSEASAGTLQPTVSLLVKAQAERVRPEFTQLAIQWRKDTQHLSQVSKKVLHPAYFRIMGMGPSVVPLLLEALKNQPAHWFAALTATTNQDPVPPGSNPSAARAAWLAWGRTNGLID